MKAEEMNRIFDRCIRDYHKTDDVNADENNPFEGGTFEHLIYRKCHVDTVQWHLEDIIRNPIIRAEEALEIKRRIDKSNQVRTDLVEKIDDFYVEHFREIEPKASARLNTESPAWAIDRLSILALKIYHMEIEAHRNGAHETKLNQNKAKLNVLLTQRNDLSVAIDELLEDIEAGNRIMKVYRQMKMYNDPELNPVLYASKPS